MVTTRRRGMVAEGCRVAVESLCARQSLHVSYFNFQPRIFLRKSMHLFFHGSILFLQLAELVFAADASSCGVAAVVFALGCLPRLLESVVRIFFEMTFFAGQFVV